MIPEGKVSPDDVVVEAFAEGELPFLADRLGVHGNERDIPVTRNRRWKFTNILDQVDTDKDLGEKRGAFKARLGSWHRQRWESRSDETVAQPYVREIVANPDPERYC